MKLTVIQMLSDNVTPVLLKPQIFYEGLVVWLEPPDIITLEYHTGKGENMFKHKTEDFHLLY